MNRGADFRAGKLRVRIRALALLCAALVALIIPGLYIAVVYGSRTETMQFEALLSARLLARHAYASGPLWIYQDHRLDEILASVENPNLVTAQAIYDTGGQLVHSRGKIAGFPIMARGDIFASGERVGHIEVREDFEPYLWRTLLLFLFSLGLGVLMYIGIHRMPVSALDRTMAELEVTYRQLKDHAETAALARDEADAASKAKTDFLANMSHELRTPLNAVLGFSDVMRTEMFGALTARYREYADNIHKSGTHLMKILNDILDLSRIEANKVEVSIALIDLREVLTSCHQIIQPRVAEAGLSLEVVLGDAPLAVHGDATRLMQVFLNLLSNAVKFTPRGGRIVVSTQIGADNVSVVVRDSGIGMRSGDIPRALERFRQLGKASTRSHSGAGLGLPISKSLVDLHGGTLHIDSAPDKGTSVTVSLPLAVPQMLRKTA